MTLRVPKLDPPLSPPQLAGYLAIAVLPALFAAVFATANAALSHIPTARQVALRDSLEDRSREAIDRYIENGQAIESRWLTLRVLGIALSAILLARIVPEATVFKPGVAALAALLAYGVPAEIGILVAARRSESSAVFLLRVLRPFELIAAPLAIPIAWIGAAVSRSVPRTSAKVTEQEVELIVHESEMNGSLAHDQGEMIRNVLEFGDLTAGNVMIPRTQVTTIEIETPIEHVLTVAEEKGHSRFPVYDGSTDNVVGILHVKDLTHVLGKSKAADISLDDITRKPALFIPAGQSASSVLKDMRSRRQHMGVVLDEFGGMSGVVTLEDLIEEIVGDIRDEHDREEAPIVDLGDGRLMVDASVSIADLSRYLGAELPEEGDYNSLGGFIVARVGRVPPEGASVTVGDLEFVVREADDRHVSKVEIVRTPPAPDSVAPGSSSRNRISAA